MKHKKVKKKSEKSDLDIFFLLLQTNRIRDGYSGPRNWKEIPFELLSIESDIAVGAYGKIQKAKLRNENERDTIDVALKALQDKKYQSMFEYAVFYSELCFLTDFNHPNIVRAFGAITPRGEIKLGTRKAFENDESSSIDRHIIILEYCERGNLFDHLAQIRKKTRKQEDISVSA